MKKVLGILLAVFLCLGFASASMAQLDNADNDRDGRGGVWTCKGVMIFAGAFLCTSTAAESDAITIQANVGTIDGSLYYGCRRWVDKPESYAKLYGSVSENTGIAALNNASGNFNNQGNTIAASLSAGCEASLAHAMAFAFQGNLLNLNFAVKKYVVATLSDSVNDNKGVAAVNNAAGSQNNQTNTVAIAAGLNSKIALSEATLAQTNILGIAITLGGENGAYICESITGNHGVAAVNNSAGALNNQANVIAISGSHP